MFNPLKVIANVFTAILDGLKFLVNRYAFISLKNTYGDDLEISVSTADLTILHTWKHYPKDGYNYNAKNLRDSLRAVIDNLDYAYDKINQDLCLQMKCCNSALLRSKANKPVQAQDVKKLFGSNPLKDLSHNLFGCIGFQIITVPLQVSNTYRKESAGIIALNDIIDWKGDTSIVLTMSFGEAKQIIDDIDYSIIKLTGFKEARKMAINDTELRAKIRTIESNLNQSVDDGKLTVAQKTLSMSYVDSIGELNRSVLMLDMSIGLFIDNYIEALKSLSETLTQTMK